jgi:hypothetical protein
VFTNVAVTGPFARTENGGQKLHMDLSSPELYDLDTKTEKKCCDTVIPSQKGIYKNFGKTMKLKWGDRERVE